MGMELKIMFYQGARGKWGWPVSLFSSLPWVSVALTSKLPKLSHSGIHSMSNNTLAALWAIGPCLQQLSPSLRETPWSRKLHDRTYSLRVFACALQGVFRKVECHWQITPSVPEISFHMTVPWIILAFLTFLSYPNNVQSMCHNWGY